jgi:dihydropteroate synthase
MQDNPSYKDVLAEVSSFLKAQASKAIKAGVKKDKIILDPGIGFGKTTNHNLEILKNLKEISSLGYYTLLGTSRKKIFSEVSVANNPVDRLPGTCVTSAIGVMADVNIFRVHDVWQNKQAVDVAYAIKNV